ncbi:MAG: type II toxin-antitoxin system RelE/ParE family toxin [Betaproteobacteria bacterium]|nr:type II toxin-antitoxin system RelE/ParE family toxin [Betaproteobacteria bacterium]
MKLKWTSTAHSDLMRLYEFMAPVSKPAAARAVQTLTRSLVVLLANPRIGQQLSQFEPRETRRILTARYEIRYEIQDETIYVLRLWHEQKSEIRSHL